MVRMPSVALPATVLALVSACSSSSKGEPRTVPPPPAPAGGGCSTTGSNSGSFLPLLAVFLVGGLRKRREG